MAEAGHHASRVFVDQEGNLNLNGAEFRNDADTDISAGLEALDGSSQPSVSPKEASATVAATGSVQGDAAALSQGLNFVTGADGTKGVILPSAAAGLRLIVVNTDAASNLLVYPSTGGAINGGSANAADTVGVHTAGVFVSDGTDFWTVPKNLG